MAQDDRISDFPPADALTGAELYAAVQDGVTKKTTLPVMSVLQGTRVRETFRGFVSGSGTLLEQAAASINAGAQFTVQPNFLGIVTFVTNADQFATADSLVTKVSFIIKLGAGTYGSGGTTLTSGFLFQIAPINVEVDSDYYFELGNIGTSTIEDFVNGSGPYIVSGLSVFTATQNGDEKIWLFTGGDGTFGTGATPTTAGMFVDLSTQDIIPSSEYLQAITNSEATHTLEAVNLNRTTTFTVSTVITIPNSVFIDEVTTRQQAWLSFKNNWTINYPTTDGLATISGGAGALVYAERRELSNEWIVKRVDEGAFEIPTLQEVTDEGSVTTKQITVASDVVVGKGNNPDGVNNRNTALGKSALAAASGLNNQTNNVAVGYDSGVNMTTGDSNTAIGADSLRQLTTGSNNTAIGFSALRSITTAFSNSVLGFALRNLTSGNSNVAIGNNAGNNRPPASGNPTLTSISNSVLIGDSATVEENGLTNVIVIGKDARTATSNTATIGNDSIVKTFLKGALKLVARTRASVSGLAAGLFIFDSEDTNRPTVHNGTEWKALAYKDEAKYEALMFAVSDEDTLLTTGTAKITFRMPYAMTLQEVRASVKTAPTGANIVVDINENGTTILSTKLSIDATEKTSTTATTPPVISDTALADDSEITIDIDQIGSTIAGAGLKVTLIGVRV
jgi:hypothetical protein